MLDLRAPSPAPLTMVSPSRANDLLACPYRVAYQLDEAWRGLRRPNTAALLGTAVHSLLESAGRRIVSSDDDVTIRRFAESRWDELMARATSTLADAWRPASTPPPEDWPGYQLLRAEVLSRFVRLHHRDFEVASGAAAASVEKTLTDAETRLTGRPDRVEEGPDGTEVVDLKTTRNQGEPTTQQLRQLMIYAFLVQRNSGEWPVALSIEDTIGRRWSTVTDPDGVLALIRQVTEAREAFETARASGALEVTARPDPDTCRWCPSRLVCRPYWDKLETAWGHGSVAGRPLPSDAALKVVVERPIDAAGETWSISGTPLDCRPTSDFTMVDAGPTSGPRHLRWRWTTRTWQQADIANTEPGQ
jgi:RecB family exonuclease